MRLQSAIFDMDGTLLDSMPIWQGLGAAMMRDLGFAPDAALEAKLKTLSLRDGVAYCKDYYQLAQTVEELVGLVFDKIHEFYCERVQTKPGVEKFLSLLKMEGVWMYVATATDRPLAEAALRHAGIDGYFRGLITTAEVGQGKGESAEIYERAMRRLQSNKKDTVVFEDAFHAIRTAKAAGFRVAAVYDAAEEENQPAIRQMADYYIRSFEEMFETRALDLAPLETDSPSGGEPGGLFYGYKRVISASRAASGAASVLAASSRAVRKLPLPRPAARASARRAQTFQKEEASAAATAASGSTAANTPHRTESIQPVPVTRAIRPLPPVTHQIRSPSVIRSSGPVRSTAVLRRRARAMAKSRRSARLAGSGLSTPCSRPSSPNKAWASPRFTRNMAGVNSSSSARTCPSRQGLAPTPTGSSTTG